MNQQQSMANHGPFGEAFDRTMMTEALKLAYKALANAEVPIGAIVIDAAGKIISRGYNQVETRGSQLAHAECIAIERAAKRVGDWRLVGCWIYVTLEPCSMCMGLIRLSRLAGVVFGATSPLFGYHLDNTGHYPVYQRDVFATVGNVEADRAASLLRQFFKGKRDKKGGQTKK